MKKTLVLTLTMLVLVGVAFSVTTLNLAMWGSPDEEAVYKKIIAAFEEANPGVKVQVSVQPWGAYWQQLQTKIVAGSAPDVFAVNGGWLQVFASKGVLLDITDLIYGDPASKNLIESELFPEAVNTFKYHGKLYGLPRDFNTYVVFYNKTMFDEAGVPYPSLDWTWEDFLDIAKKLTKDVDGDGRLDQWGVIIPTNPDYWMPFIWQNGGEILNADKTKSLFDSPQNVETFQFLADLILKYHVSPTISQQAAFGWNPFGSGKIGMYITGKWMVPTYSAIQNFDWDVQVLPRGKKMAAIANAVGFTVFNKTKHPKEAVELLKFIATEGQKYLLELGSSVPTSKSAAFSAEFMDPTKKPDNKFAFLIEIPYSHILPFHPKWNELWDVWSKYPELIFTGKLSPEYGVKKMHMEIEKILSSK